LALQLGLMTGKTDLSKRRFLDSLPGRFLMVLIITLGMASLILGFVQINAGIPSVLLKWAAAAWIGIITGLATNFLLASIHNVIRYLAALSAMFLGLGFIGLVSGGEFGMDLWSDVIAADDWSWLGQLLIGGLFCGLVFWAWRFVPQQGATAKKKTKPLKTTSQKTQSKSKSKTTVKTGKDPARVKPSENRKVKAGSLKVSQKRRPAKTSKKKAAAGSRSTGSGKTTAPRKKVTVAGTKSTRQISTRKKSTASRSRKSTGGTRRKSTTRATPKKAKASPFWVSRWALLQTKTRDLWKNGQAAQQHMRKRLTPKTGSPKARVKDRRARTKTTRRRRQSESVRLVGVAEHRCPYCLELVEDNDVRGIRVCPICHTHHHADCWAETGVCQVPHQND